MYHYIPYVQLPLLDIAQINGKIGEKKANMLHQLEDKLAYKFYSSAY